MKRIPWTFVFPFDNGGETSVTGYTPLPEKGVDYNTPADQEAIVQQVIAALGTPVFGRVEADKKIILTANSLAAGTYELWFENEEGAQSKVCDYNYSGSSNVPSYTNLFDPATAVLNTRMSASSQTSKAQDGYVMTAVISIPETTITSDYDENTPYIAVPASMWTGSANIFTWKNGDTYGYMDVNGTPGTVLGDWVKIPLRDQWGQNHTTDGVVISLYVKGSAITIADVQNLEIYFNECPA